MSEIDKAVVFAILMENNRGIIDKSPTYVLEKWDLVKNMSSPENILDVENLSKFKYWYNRWLSEPPDR